VKALVEAGHEVTGVARSHEKAELVRSLGATPAAVDVFDPGTLNEAVAGHDVVINLATHIPPVSKAALPGAWNENARLRTEGAANLADAALAAGAGRYIQESIAFSYPDSGDRWLDEDIPLDMPAFGESLAVAEAQAARVTEAGAIGIVLRFGQFYAPDAAHTIAMAKAARRRVSPAMGPADGYLTSIHAADAGSAVVAALRAPAGTYNVTDDEPVTRAEFDKIVAKALGVKPARRVPSTLAKVGGSKMRFLMRSQRVTNRRFKDTTGWAPSFPTIRESWPAMAPELTED
jgi:nucleoside-diphosphate-sugar epimerase